MKRFIEWTSVLTIIVAVAMASLLCGIEVANAIADAIGRGLWQMAVIVPALVATAAVVDVFFILGLKKFSDGMAE